MSKEKVLKNARSVLMILLGNCIYAAGVEFFLVPARIATAGVTGISIAISSVTGVRVSLYALILNIIFWLLGLILLGKEFAGKTLLSSISYPAFLALFEGLTGDFVLTEDRLICTVFSGVLMGIALGIVIREDSSIGGVDVISLALKKYLRFPVSVCMYAVDCITLVMQILVFSRDAILYGVLNILVYTVVLDKVLLSGSSRTEIKVVSKEYRKIADGIMQSADRGVTILHGEGGYTGDDTEMVLSVVSNRQLARVERVIHSIDPHALVIIGRVTEVQGRGFTLDKYTE